MKTPTLALDVRDLQPVGPNGIVPLLLRETMPNDRCAFTMLLIQDLRTHPPEHPDRLSPQQRHEQWRRLRDVPLTKDKTIGQFLSGPSSGGGPLEELDSCSRTVLAAQLQRQDLLARLHRLDALAALMGEAPGAAA